MLKFFKRKTKNLNEILNYFETGWTIEKELKGKSRKDYFIVSPEARKYFFSDLKQNPDYFTNYENNLEEERLNAIKFLKLLSKKRVSYLSKLVENYCNKK